MTHKSQCKPILDKLFHASSPNRIQLSYVDIFCIYLTFNQHPILCFKKTDFNTLLFRETNTVIAILKKKQWIAIRCLTCSVACFHVSMLTCCRWQERHFNFSNPANADTMIFSWTAVIRKWILQIAICAWCPHAASDVQIDLRTKNDLHLYQPNSSYVIPFLNS